VLAERRGTVACRCNHGRWSDSSSVRQAALDRSDAGRRLACPGQHALRHADADRQASMITVEFHDDDTDTGTGTDILARILADTSDTRDLLTLFLCQAERHADILATILAKMSARMSVLVSASWNASFTSLSTPSPGGVRTSVTSVTR